MLSTWLQNWFLVPLSTALGVVVSAVIMYGAIILYIRLIGLRSLSKMSSFDFVMTIGIGTLMASTLLAPEPKVVQGLVGAGSLFVLQLVVAKARQSWSAFAEVIDNDPLLLMREGEMLHQNMQKVSVTEDDIWAKLREANVIHMGQVRAVVFETTGDVTVLHSPEDGPDLDEVLLTGVRQS